MIDKTIKKLNISYARYLKNRIADRYRSSDESTRAERHSKKVKFLKKFLFYTILLLVKAIIIWPLLLKNSEKYKVNFDSKKEDSQQQSQQNLDDNKEKKRQVIQDIPVMIAPKFFGMDDNLQPYNISADSGVSVNSDKVVLDNIEGDLRLKNNSKLEIKSNDGDYFINKKEVRLAGDVNLKIDDDYNFSTRIAYIFFKENMATGVDEVKIKGSLGDINANGFTIKNSGDEVFLYGGVELISDPKNIE